MNPRRLEGLFFFQSYSDLLQSVGNVVVARSSRSRIVCMAMVRAQGRQLACSVSPTASAKSTFCRMSDSLSASYIEPLPFLCPVRLPLVTADASHYRVQSALMQPASPITTQRRAPSALNATATMAFGVFAAVLLRAYIIAIVPAQILLRLRSRSSELMAFSVLGPVLDTALLPRQLRASG